MIRSLSHFFLLALVTRYFTDYMQYQSGSKTFLISNQKKTKTKKIQLTCGGNRLFPQSTMNHEHKI